MIKDVKTWQAWEKEYLKKESTRVEERLRLLEAMYTEARALKVFPLQNPLEGLETKIEMVRILHVSKAS